LGNRRLDRLVDVEEAQFTGAQRMTEVAGLGTFADDVSSDDPVVEDERCAVVARGIVDGDMDAVAVAAGWMNAASVGQEAGLAGGTGQEDCATRS